MTAPPPPPREDLPDEVTEAYRRYSAFEVAHPGTQTRAAILAEATRAAREQQRGPQRGTLYRWQWKAAASFAVVGLVGVFTLQIFRRPPAVVPAPTALSAPESTARELNEVAGNSAPIIRTPAAVPITPRPGNPTPSRPRQDRASDTAQYAATAAAPAAPTQTEAPSMTASSARAAPLVASKTTRSASANGAVARNGSSQIAHAFEVSASVREGCDRIIREKLNGEQHCRMARTELEKLQSEPRDEVWAAETEARMRDTIDQTPGESAGRYTIRALECRRSLCAIEIASLMNPYPEPTLRRKLIEEGKVFVATPPPLYMSAVELDSTVQQVYVTVWIYTRRDN